MCTSRLSPWPSFVFNTYFKDLNQATNFAKFIVLLMTQTYLISVNLSKLNKYLNLNMKNLTDWLNAYKISSHFKGFQVCRVGLCEMLLSIVWSGYQPPLLPPPSKTPPLSCQAPLFRQSTPLYQFFETPHPWMSDFSVKIW